MSITLPWPSRLGGAHSDTAFICGIVIQCMVDAVQNTKSQCWQSSQISYQKQAFSPHVPLGWTFSFFFFLMTFKSIHNVLLFRPNLKLREVWLTQQPQGRDSRIVSEPWHSFREAIFKEMKGLEFSRIITPVVPVSQFAPCQVPHGPPLRESRAVNVEAFWETVSLCWALRWRYLQFCRAFYSWAHITV